MQKSTALFVAMVGGIFLFLGGTVVAEKTDKTRADDIRTGTFTDTFSFGTTTYAYTAHVPSKIKERGKAPLLLVFPPGGDTPTEMMEKTEFNTIANTEGFITMYIKSSPHGWAFPPSETGDFSVPEKDVAFLRPFIQHLTNSLPIDTERIYGTGFSTGALYIQEVACRTNIFAAIAPVSGGGTLPASCTQTPVMFWHETTSRDEFVNPPWIHINKCNDAGTRKIIDPLFATTTVSIKKFSGCVEENPLSVYVVHGGTHQWPDVKIPQETNAAPLTPAEIMWDFLSRFSNKKQ